MNVADIRQQLKEMYRNGEFVIDKTGSQMVEIINANFRADEDAIFGTPSHDYINREIQWYESMSLCVDDIPGGPPLIWQQVAGKTTREINSNYGWCIFSPDNFSQYESVKNELVRNRDSRRAIMIYTRPSMQVDYCRDGMSDFCCTNNVQYFIRNNRLMTIVNQRSMDAVYGFKNDRAWAIYVINKLLTDLQPYYPELTAENPLWTTGSLHVYPRHFKFLEGN